MRLPFITIWRRNNLSSFLYIPVLIGLTCILTSCNGGGGGSGSVNNVVSSPGGISGSSGISIGGFGSDGPVSGGTISVFHNLGLCDSTETGEDASYSLILENYCQPPYEIELSGGIDLVTSLNNDSTMLSLSLAGNQINVSPLTTIIYYAALARAGGDFTQVQNEDLDLVTLWATRKFNFGIDAAGSGSSAFDPLSGNIDTSNAIAFVKASEGLIETTRRVALLWTGQVTNQTIEDVLAALGEDISDGLLDGKNFDGTELPEMSRLSSLWEITTATVAMEMMLNQMQITLTDNQYIQEGRSELPYNEVNDGLATAVTAISNLSFNTANSSVQNIHPTSQFIDQAKAASIAALVLANQTHIDLTNYINFINALNSMRDTINANGSTSTPVAGFDQTLLDNLSTNAKSIVEVIIGYNSGDTTFEAFSAALDEAVDTVITKSTPVTNVARHLLVEWEYPANATHDGFKIYRQGITDPLCIITDPDGLVRSTKGYNCYITAEPGEEINIYMSAYSEDTDVPESPSRLYTNAMPEAQFMTQDALSGKCPLDIKFAANEKLSPVEKAIRDYQWSFDSVANDSGYIVFHNYGSADTYSVEMTVTDTDDTGRYSISNTAQAIFDVACK